MAKQPDDVSPDRSRPQDRPAPATSQPERDQPANGPHGRSAAQSVADLLRTFNDSREQLATRDPRLVARIETLSDQFWDRPADRLSDPKFKTELAYALEDAEKILGPVAADRTLRNELRQLAPDAPGLTNHNMRQLLSLTPTIDDADLVTRLRDKAFEIARKSNQDSNAVVNDINALSFQILKAPRREPVAADPPSAAPESAASEQPLSVRAPAASSRAQMEIDAFGPDPSSARRSRSLDQARPDASSQPRAATAGDGPASARQDANAAQTAAAAPPSRDQDKPSPSSTRADAPDAARQSADAAEKAPAADKNQGQGDASDKHDENSKTQQTDAAQQKHVLGGLVGKTVGAVGEVGEAVGDVIGAVGRGASAFGRLLQAAAPETTKRYAQSEGTVAVLQKVAHNEPNRAAQGQSQQTNQNDVQNRLQSFSKRMDPKREDSRLTAALTSGQTALEALEELQQTNASILTRIQDAAANNKGGLKAVIAGMRTGGPFEDLRNEFEAALDKNDALRAAHQRATSALEQYGKDRAEAVAAIAASPDPNRWTASFEKLDAQIGAAASAVPAKKPGDSLLDRLGETAKEIVEKVLEKIHGLFHRGPESRPSPSPGP